MPSIGYWTLFLILILSSYGAVASFAGARRRSPGLIASAGKALLVTAVLVTIVSAILLYLLITHDFQVRYVYQYSSMHLDLIYTVSAFWAGEAGSMLLWLWLLAVISAILTVYSVRPKELRPYLLSTMAVTEAFFCLLLICVSNPFETLTFKPTEGIGMLPLLENPGMVVHPPLLFLGYAGYTVPFAFALAALMSGELTRDWLKATRPWRLFAWLSLGIGILTGAWWSYVELGWGGYWAWDPVENASLLPWLTGTAFLHTSVMEERRGMNRAWNIVLAAVSFAFCLFATLVTRGGIIVSDLHGFFRAVQPIAYLLLGFIGLVVGASFLLICFRRRELSSGREVENLVSREGSILLAAGLFCGIALIVFVGTVYPTLAQIASGVAFSVDASFYDRATGPPAMAIICLMGICPVIGWRRMTAKSLRRLLLSVTISLVVTAVAFVLGVKQAFPLISAAVCAFTVASFVAVFARELSGRHRSTGRKVARALVELISKGHRRWGAYLVHLGIVLIVAGFTGSKAYKSAQLVALNPGESTTIRDYRLHYERYSIEELNPEPETYQSRIRFATTLGVYGASSRLSTLVAEKNYHWVLDNPWVTEVAIRSSLKEDLYVILASLDENGLAAFRIVINPLVNWIWIGGGVALVGTVIAAWPKRRG